jgi:phosphoglucosamine mutase
MTEYPQVLVNVTVLDRDGLAAATRIWAAVDAAQGKLGDDGRILARASGTEPLVRVMVEAASVEVAQGMADDVAAVVDAELG